MAKSPLVVFGASSFSEIAVEYFKRQPFFEPIAICVDDQFARFSEIFGLPVIPLSNLQEELDPAETFFHVAITYTELNDLRRARVLKLKSLGYRPASYVSDACFVDETAILGEHIFIFEDNVIQPFVKIGSRVVLWSGNHIGHHSNVQDDVFISSHVVVSGHCVIGERTFLGVNSSVGNNVKVGRDNWVLPGSILLQDSGNNELWKPPRSVIGSTRPIDRRKGLNQ